jgi:hypothetical protein
VAIKLDEFNYDLVENYYLQNLIANQIWFFGSHSNEESTPQSFNTELNARNFLKRTTFGVKYDALDFAFMIPFITWSENKIYTQYDDNAVLKDEPFYIITEPDIEGGNYHVFKCISNFNKRPSLVKPEYTPSIEDGFYYLSDGYIWKYMTSVPSSVYKKFNSRGLLPIIRNEDVEEVADTGIHNIIVENSGLNSGYQKITGLVNSINVSGAITTVFLKNLFSQSDSTVPIFEIPNIYNERTLYIQKSSVSSQIGAIQARITSSGVQSFNPFVTITTPVGFTIEPEDTIQILPRIVIEGDGEGASAIATFNETASSITEVRMLESGTGYTDAIARVVDPIGFDPSNVDRDDERCLLRPIISPRGGHGSNIIRELKCKRIGLSIVISSLINAEVPSSGTYSKIAIVKNPEFNDEPFLGTAFDNRISLVLGSLPSNLSVGMTVTQENVSGVVHEIDTSSNTIYIVNYDGPYSNTFVDTLPLQINNVNFDINTINYSPYISKTGSVLIMSDVDQIERTPENSERIKIILDF